MYVGPDNGLLLPAADRFGGVAEAHELANPDVRARARLAHVPRPRPVLAGGGAPRASASRSPSSGRRSTRRSSCGSTSRSRRSARRRSARPCSASTASGTSRSTSRATTSSARRSCPGRGSRSSRASERYFAVAARTFGDAGVGELHPVRGQLPERRRRCLARQRSGAARRRGRKRPPDQRCDERRHRAPDHRRGRPPPVPLARSAGTVARHVRPHRADVGDAASTGAPRRARCSRSTGLPDAGARARPRHRDGRRRARARAPASRAPR